jgi:hypothetical protein
MSPRQKALPEYWSGVIVHPKCITPIEVGLKKAAAGNSFRGTYTFPQTKPPEKGVFTAELYGQLLFIKLTMDGEKIHFHMNVIGQDIAEMMLYGAIPRSKGGTPHATLTLFPSKKTADVPDSWPIVRVWQTLYLKGL